ncbi:MAG: glycerol-3-phosphate acyltransferase [Leptolyngbyaceae cyanobacterium]
MNLSTFGVMLAISAIAFIIGGLPIIAGLVQGLTQQRLTQLGTGNISVSAAFYHGGTKVGLLAVLSEALKGIGVVLLARWLLPDLSAGEIVALIALVAGRFTLGRGAGTTNVVWGYIAHDWVIAASIFAVSGILFILMRRRQTARLGILVLIPLFEALRRPNEPGAIAAATILSLLIAWIYQQLPDDLALSRQPTSTSSRKMFQFLKGSEVIGSLNDPPNAAQMGQKAATLAQLKQRGYVVPEGWVLPPASSVPSLIAHLEKSNADPWQQAWVVRSSAIGEDSPDTSGAGQYTSIAGVMSATVMAAAIAECRAAYFQAGAAQYRRDQGLVDQAGLSLLVQQQITGQFSGVAFSRDPVQPDDAVLVEALAGGADQVVSGRVTPQQYRITVDETAIASCLPTDFATLTLPLEPETTVPPALIDQVAALARHLELYYHGIPQDIEWSYDGKTLWLLQARPITTLTPIWTRKIAAEVIPGMIRPLTWSINRPLTCGVWGQLFTIGLGKRAAGLNFEDTATLHYSRAYFNATLLGQLFRRMGLPPESLEFLTMGTKFSRPPWASTLGNLPGLLRLLKRMWQLPSDFEQDDHQTLAPAIQFLREQPATTLTVPELFERIDSILTQLNKATYYNILAPLSFALLRGIFKIPETALDPQHQPEIASLQLVKALAQRAQQQAPEVIARLRDAAASTAPADLWQGLLQTPGGQAIAADLADIIQQYGYLSEVGTDIAVPTWQEDPQPVQTLLIQFLLNPPRAATSAESDSERQASNWRYRQVQQRFDLKGRVATVYLILLAELRWSLLALEQTAIAHRLLDEPGDAFFLTDAELKTCLTNHETMQALVTQRRSQFAQHGAFATVPFVVYGNTPPPDLHPGSSDLPLSAKFQQGIGASPGQVEGTVRVLTSLQLSEKLAPNTILVVPYTDAGWAPVLAQVAGLIAEVGGKLSHGAIVAREYQIPAVMNIADATQQFHDGQRIRIDGRFGTVEILDEITTT